MGQTMVKDFDSFKDSILKETQVIAELAALSHEELVEMIKELNQICSKMVDADGKMLRFAINCESDTSIFWKGTVQIACLRSMRDSNEVSDVKLFKLKPFLQAYKVMSHHIKPMSEIDFSTGQSSSGEVNETLSRKPISTSMILNQICPSADATDLEECIICMERKPEVTLPCTHSYCLFCIEQWNVSNKTCPVCREILEDPGDSWVIPAVPESAEVNAELQKALNGLTAKFSEEI